MDLDKAFTMFSYLFGGSSKFKSKNKSSLPSSQSNMNQPPSQSRPSGDYDDVQLDGGGANTTNGNGRTSFSDHRPQTTSDGSFVGGGGTTISPAYPPVPSFSRPSYASSSSSQRYPPLSATFTQLTNLLDAQSPTLLDSLAPPLSPNDPILSSLRSSLAPYQIPSAVLDSYLLHDGQDSLSFAAQEGGIGLIWGLWWMPLERVEEEWKFWRKLEMAGGERGMQDPFSANSTSNSSHYSNGPSYREGINEQEEEEGMKSFPPGWVRRKYTHPGWLPLLTDRCGNYIGVDLDPPSPTQSANQGQKSYGQAGQVIAFGREIDEKVVLFPGDGSGGWARFLASFVEDLEKGEFARLGERPSSSANGSANGGSFRERQSDEESLGGNDDGSDGSGGSGEGDNWDEDGLGERGYFETAGTYGEDVIDGVRGDPRSSNTWVLRSQFRRLAGDIEGGIIGLIAERSRRKWRSLGIGSAQPRPQATMSPRGRQGPLSVDTQPSAAPKMGAEVEEEPASAVTMKGPSTSDDNPLSPNQGDTVEVTLSPPSPKGPPASLPPLDTTSTLPTSSPRTSQDSQRQQHSNNNDKAPQSPDGFLRDPPRAYKASQRNPNSSSSSHTQSQPRTRRNPPPPPAPITVPIFSDLDFSEQGTLASPLPFNSQLSSDDPLYSSSTALGRLSFSSQRSGERTPTTPQHLLLTSRSNSTSSSTGIDLVRPSPVRPMESSTSISMMNDFAERSTTALVPGRDEDDDSMHLTSPQLGGRGGGGVEVVVQSETGNNLKRINSPLDSPYEEQGEFAPPMRSPQLG